MRLLLWSFLLAPAWAQAPAPFRALDRQLPAAVRAFHAELPGPNLAWVVFVRPGPDAQVRTLGSDTKAGKEAMTSMARKAGALVAINTVYFNTKSEPCRVVGWLVAGGQELSPPTRAIERNGRSLPVARAAFALDRQHGMEFGWALGTDQGVRRLLSPWDGQAAAASREAGAWHPCESALSAGPMLWLGGVPVNSRKEERLFENEDVRHPRTALGRTRDGQLVWVVVDGRYKDRRSVGMSIAELTQLMGSLGCVDALNLDGGGSSTLVIGGELINRPEGGTFERPVPAGLGVFVPGFQPAASQPTASQPAASRPARGGR